MFANSLFNTSRPISEAMDTMEMHQEALGRYNAMFRDTSSASTLVDERFRVLSQAISQEQSTISTMMSLLSNNRQNESNLLQSKNNTLNVFQK